MNTPRPIDFDNGDDLGDILGDGASQGPRVLPTDAGLARIREHGIGQAPVAEAFKIPCAKCKGRGRFIAYTGRDAGPCFACKGKGHHERKTAPTVLAKRREQATTRKVKTAEGNMAAFAAAHPQAAAWIVAEAGGFAFAAEMKAKVERYGTDIHPGALAAIERCATRAAEKTAARQADRVSQETRQVDLNASKVKEAFDTARAKGLKRIALRFDGLKIKADRNDPNKLIVTDGKPYAESTYYGKIEGGIFKPTRACTDDLKARLAKIAEDPAAAAKVYGQETGTCCCCGAELTDANSIAAGIGPICEGNFGF